MNLTVAPQGGTDQGCRTSETDFGDPGSTTRSGRAATFPHGARIGVPDSSPRANAVDKVFLHRRFLNSPSLASMSDPAEVYFTRLLSASEADTYGYFEVDPYRIHAVAFHPRRKWPWNPTPERVRAWFGEYAAAGILQLWSQDGRVYGFWTHWTEFNNPDTRQRRKFPHTPQVNVAHASGEIREDAERSGGTREDPGGSGQIPLSGSGSGLGYGPGTYLVDKSTARVPGKTYPEDFLEFWSLLPARCRIKKPKAAAAWKAKHPPIEEVRTALKWQTKDPGLTQEDFRFFPRAEAYINGGRWEDARPEPATSTYPQREVKNVLPTDIKPFVGPPKDWESQIEAVAPKGGTEPC